MTPERQVAVVTDSACSIRPGDPLLERYPVRIVPLQLKFFEGGRWIDVDELSLTADEFYRKMRTSQELPQTSGAATGPLTEIYRELAQKGKDVISIHITSKHSVAFNSAVLAARQERENAPGLSIEVIDSKQISLGTWLLVEQAVALANQGKILEEIKFEVLKTVPKIDLLASLSTLENVIKGGRIPMLAGFLGQALKIVPILRLSGGGENAGEIKPVKKSRTRKARREMVEMVKSEGELVRLVILHTNFLEGALEVKEGLLPIFDREILIRDAGPVLGVHAGEGAVGVVFQKA